MKKLIYVQGHKDGKPYKTFSKTVNPSSFGRLIEYNLPPSQQVQQQKVFNHLI